jgi:probable F420-dependent oxidoreductase
VKLGLYGINVGPCALPGTSARVARAAEAAGLASLWTAEHVVLPDPQVPPSPLPPRTPLLDPAVALAHVAAHTTTIRLATGIVILPQRNPLVLAKELASVDVLSGGRLVFGLGAGYLAPEFRALGVPFEDRGARTDEYPEAILALWTQPEPRYAGRFVSFAGVDAAPRPVQKPHPPIVVGGHSAPAYRRAIARGNGWYGFNLDLEAARRSLEGLRAAADRTARPAALGELEVIVTPPPGIDRDGVRRYRDLGVHHLALLPPGLSEDAVVRFLEEQAPRLVGAA